MFTLGDIFFKVELPFNIIYYFSFNAGKRRECNYGFTLWGQCSSSGDGNEVGMGTNYITVSFSTPYSTSTGHIKHPLHLQMHLLHYILIN